MTRTKIGTGQQTACECRPSGAHRCAAICTHGLRRGLIDVAAPRLNFPTRERTMYTLQRAGFDTCSIGRMIICCNGCRSVSGFVPGFAG